MANIPSVPIACMNIGSSIGNLSCCYANDQSAPICETLFPPKDGFLQNGCLTNDCVDDCSELGTLYTSRLQENLTGNGYLPVARYMACANIPSIARYANQSLLSSNITEAVRQYIVPNTTEASLQDVTSAVTDCLSSTCRSSRNSSFCYDNYCSPVMLLQNNTSPNIEAINTCLYTLCSNPLEALPWADADVIGIGVGGFHLACNCEITNRKSFSGLLVIRHPKRIHCYTLARLSGLYHRSAQKRRTWKTIQEIRAWETLQILDRASARVPQVPVLLQRNPHDCLTYLWHLRNRHVGNILTDATRNKQSSPCDLRLPSPLLLPETIDGNHTSDPLSVHPINPGLLESLQASYSTGGLR